MLRSSGALVSLLGVGLGLAVVACSSATTARDGAGGKDDDVTSTSPAPAGNPSAAGGASAAPVAPPRAVHSLANLGDSISQGFDADDSLPLDVGLVNTAPAQVFHDNPTLSWVQGSDPRVGSIASHYRALDPSLVVTPLSRAGAELVAEHNGLPDLEQQARALGATGAKPDLVFVLMGGNDVCNRARSKNDDPTATLYSVDEWRAGAVRGLTALAEVLPRGATARFVSMPRVDLLYDALGSTEVPAKLASPAGPIDGVTTCKTLWTITSAIISNGICPVVTTEPSAARRAAIGARIDTYNAVLAEEVRRFGRDAALNPNRIVFESDWHGSLGEGAPKNSSGGTFVFEPKHISRLDCFHPSIEGQQAIADVVLRRATWNP